MSGNIEIKSNMNEVMRATELAMKRATVMVGGTIEGHAKEYCPKDTGLLQNSITYAMGGQVPNIESYYSNEEDKNGKPIERKEGHYSGNAPNDEDKTVTVYVGTNVQYAPYQELGAPNINLQARPFLRPAFENHQNEIEQIMHQCFSALK